MGSEQHDAALAYHRKVLGDVWTVSEQTWRPVRDVLNWLYSVEHLHKARLKKDYFAARNQNADGRALGGIIWIRGESVHWNVDATLFTLGMPKPLPGSGYPVRLSERVAVWRHRADLPKPHQTETNHRDVMYDQHVAGREILRPIDEAIRFLQTLSF